jgi:hypothetical protein
MGIILWPHLTKVRCVTRPPTKGIVFLFMLDLVNTSCLICNSHQSLFNFLNAYSMSVTANTIYTTSFPKRPDITGAPNQVFKFDNFLYPLIGGIKANTISAIRTINLGSLCNQYLYAPQIHFSLAGKPIALIGNLSNKMSEFSLIKIDVMSIHRLSLY